jgi:IS605 OrfB family transposase
VKGGAVWVNRSASFDAAQQGLGPSMSRAEVWDMLEPFFGSPDLYLAPMALGDGGDASETKPKDLVKTAGQWLSSRFGTGGGADFARFAKAYELMGNAAAAMMAPIEPVCFFSQLAASLDSLAPIASDAAGVLSLVSGPGYKSATRNLLKQFADRSFLAAEDLDKFSITVRQDASTALERVGRKGGREWSNRLLASVEAACGFSYLGPLIQGTEDGQGDLERHAARHSEFAVMLDHAARRVSLAHTWIKRAEAERRKFTVDAAKLDPLRASYPEAVGWLDSFSSRRTVSSNAGEPYRIRPRAIEGWETVVKSWRAANCSSGEDRVEAARQLQDDEVVEKFGDIQLFEALAEDDARCVWTQGSNVLNDYVAATEAREMRQRFKVPAYCHPHALRHPVFCDFGNSRWNVEFAFHRTRESTRLLKAKLKRLGDKLATAQRSLARASGGADCEAFQAQVGEIHRQIAKAEDELQWLSNPRGLTLDLLEFGQPSPTRLRWQSKRLAKDMALNETSPDQTLVTRADRQGRAAVAAPTSKPVGVLGLFEEKDWNCRLQAPRVQLDLLDEHLGQSGCIPHDESTWDQRARTLRDQLQWLVTFSARLQPQGPWTEFARVRGLNPDPAKWPHAESNRNRGKAVRLMLCRLPGLRVLSVDLGHRFGAACAVWEALSPESLQVLCGSMPPGANQLFHKVTKPLEDGSTASVLLRRLAPDNLDGQPHPAPWAMLDRQFLVKVQGEEGQTRKASPQELELVDQFEMALGVAPEFRLQHRLAGGIDGPGWRPSARVDEVMGHAVDSLRLGLRRLATRARLARDFSSDHRIEPGDRRSASPMSPEQLVEFRKNLLLAWHDLATSRRNPDPVAASLWSEVIAPKLAGSTLEDRPEGRQASATRQARERRNAAKVAGVAAALSSAECAQISQAWADAWNASDLELRPWLARLREWIRPRGIKQANREARSSIRRTGGLSLLRLATLRSFYQVQKAYFTRLRPDGSHAMAGESFGQRSLDALERLREQRVKQLASRIVSSALGLAPAAPSDAETKALAREGNRLQRIRLSQLEARFKPCHAVVIEDLSNYRPDQLQTRRENRQLMQWSSSKVRKCLEEGCQLNSLHLREVSAAYTSRQDSRTGAPGQRCSDVSLRDFLREGGYWEREAERIRAKLARERSAKDALVLEIFDQWRRIRNKPSPDQSKRLATGSIRLIRDGGDIFVSSGACSPSSRGLQADLNAAANIGLKAMMDPDWSGTWWRVPCLRNTLAPKMDEVKGSPAFAGLTALPFEGLANCSDTRVRELVNLWRDPTSAGLANGGLWTDWRTYSQRVEQRVARLLKMHNGLPPEDDVPM